MNNIKHTLAHEIFLKEIETPSSGAEIAQRTEAVAKGIRDAELALRSQTYDVIANPVSPDAGAQDIQDVFPEGQNLPPVLTEYVHAGSSQSGEVEWSTVVNTLEVTAKDMRDIVGARSTKDLPDNIAGQAYQGVAGSSVIDVQSAVKENTKDASLVDTEDLEDTVNHELEHEKQAKQWNAESVRIVGINEDIDRHLVSEVGAMSEQERIDHNSGEYQHMFTFLTGFVSAEEAKLAARQGDLIGLAKKINNKQGNTEDVAVTEGGGKA